MLLPPFIDQHGDPAVRALVGETLRITKEVRTILGQFYLYMALTRNRSLSMALDVRSAADGAHIVVGSLMRTLVVSTAALFDDDPKTSNLPKIIRGGLTPDVTEFLHEFHAHYDASIMAEASRTRLVGYGRKLNRGPLRPAIERIKRVRMTIVAHFDANPEPVPDQRKAIVRDYDYVIAAAAIMTGEANRWMIGRTVNFSELRKILRDEANGFCNTLELGLKTAVSSANLS
jgi:hypothetical protein